MLGLNVISRKKWYQEGKEKLEIHIVYDRLNGIAS